MINAAFQYHWLTAYDRQRMSSYKLDWDDQPQFFKSYPWSRVFPLSQSETLPACSLDELFEPGAAAAFPAPVFDLESISRLLPLTSVITAHSRFAAGEIFYRSNPAAGALYPIEIYLFHPGSPDLPAGMFHYDVRRPALELLGTGDFPAVAGNLGQPVLVLSAVFRRSAWKYRDRAYRYVLLDCGHLLGNLRLALRALGYEYELVAGFADAAVNRELGFKRDDEEAALFLVRIVSENRSVKGRRSGDAGIEGAEVPCVSGTVPDDERYPLLRAVQRLTSQSPAATVNRRKSDDALFRVKNRFSLSGTEAGVSPVCSYVESLLRRRSRRNFRSRAGGLDAACIHYLLRGLRSMAADHTAHLAVPEILFSLFGVEGLADGFYRFDPFAGTMGRRVLAAQPVDPGPACLEQRWVGLAQLRFLFCADLESLEDAHGPRVYRELGIMAGSFAQMLYLGAETLGLGCCGVGAFFDRELSCAFELPPSCDPLYLVAVGPLAGR